MRNSPCGNDGMKLLYVSDSTFPSTAANAIQIRAMTAAFARAGHIVDVTGIRAQGRSTQSAVADPPAVLWHLLQWPLHRFRVGLLALYSRLLAMRVKPQLVYTRSARLAEWMAGTSVPVVLELHALPDTDSRAEKALGRILCNPGLARVVCISHSLAEDLRRAFPLQHTNLEIVVAHDGADPGPPPVPPSRPNASFTVGYFGHLYPGKGMELIGRLAPLLPDVQFAVYGGTASDLARWRGQLLPLNIKLHGYVPHSQVRCLMEQCDVLIAPYGYKVSHVAGGDIGRWMSPLKLFEYMSAGRPILASDLPVIREVLTDGETAMLCDPGDLVNWREALQRLEAQHELRERLSKSARRTLVENYTWDARVMSVLPTLPYPRHPPIVQDSTPATGNQPCT